MNFYQVTAKIIGVNHGNKIKKNIYATSPERAKEIFYLNLDQPENVPVNKVIVDKVKQIKRDLKNTI